jgi:uncharacterized protein (DUF1330 family)
MRYAMILAGFALAFESGATAAPIDPAKAQAKAYVIVEITVTDPVVYEDYKSAIAPLAGKFGGVYLVRAGRTQAIEGEPPTGRVVVFEFPSFDHAMAFEHAPETLEASKLRRRSAKSRIFVVEGVEP